MLDQFTYKQKNIGLFVVIGLLAVLSYNMSISETFAQGSKLTKEEVKLSKAKSAPAKIIQIKKKMSGLNAQVGKLDKEFDEFQEDLLSSVVSLSTVHKVKIISIEEPHTYDRNGFEVQTAIIRLRGSFSKLTALMDELERVNGIGRLASTNFELVENKKKKMFSLEAVIHVQNFKKL